MSGEEQNEFFFTFELNEEESDSSNQDKKSIELIEKAEDKNCDDEKRKKRKKDEDQKDFNDLEVDEDKLLKDSDYSSENYLPEIDFLSNICQNNEKKDTKIFSRKTVRNESKDHSSIGRISKSNKVSRK